MRRKAANPPAMKPTMSYRLRPSPGGVFFMLGAGMVGAAGLDADNNLLMILASLCIAALVLNLLSGWRVLGGLRIHRLVPDVLEADQPFVIRYRVTNTRRWLHARCIRIAELLPRKAPVACGEGFVELLRPGEAATLHVPACGRRRGRNQFARIRLETGFPFSIFRKSVILSQDHEAVVFPPLGRLLVDIKASWRSTDGSVTAGATARCTGDEEFYGIREYRIGDNPRRIHWRRSARTGQLIVRQMTRFQDLQLWCVVNTHVAPRQPAQLDGLEQIISCAATVICEALEGGVKVGLLCNGEPLVVLPPAGGRIRRIRLLRELAVRTANASDLLAGHVARRPWPLRWRGRCLLFGATDDEDLATAARELSRAVGPTTKYVPGTTAFNRLFSPRGRDGETGSAARGPAPSGIEMAACTMEGR